MKILLTENQINRIILSESYEPKILYSDKLIEISVDFDSKIGKVNMGSGDEFFVTLRSTSNKPIIFTIQKFNPTDTSDTHVNGIIFDASKKKYGTKLTSVNMSQILNPYYEDGFRITVSKDGTFNISFTFSYTTTDKNFQPVFKTIRIPVYKQTKEDTLSNQRKKGNCKGKLNQTHLDEAIGWWKKWLNNPTTKAKFGKSFGYDSNTIEKHFTQYNNILSQTKLEYVYATNSKATAYVLTKDENENVYVNCERVMFLDYKYKDAVSTFIHEVQHLLNRYHKFYPFQDPRDDVDNLFTYYSKKIMSTFESPKEINPQLLTKKLTDMGFSLEKAAKLVEYYGYVLRSDELHLKNPNEVMSSLSSLRNVLNLNPNQKITKEMLIKNVNLEDVSFFIYQWLYSGKSLNNFLNFSNSIAMNKDDNRNLA